MSKIVLLFFLISSPFTLSQDMINKVSEGPDHRAYVNSHRPNRDKVKALISSYGQLDVMKELLDRDNRDYPAGKTFNQLIMNKLNEASINHLTETQASYILKLYEKFLQNKSLDENESEVYVNGSCEIKHLPSAVKIIINNFSHEQ